MEIACITRQLQKMKRFIPQTMDLGKGHRSAVVSDTNKSG